MKILITGAAGRIGTDLRREFGDRYERIHCLDKIPVQNLKAHEKAFVGDVADLAFVESAMQGIDGVIHLAAIPYEAPFEQMLQTNCVGTWNVYEAARRHGAKRVVFGSSNHAVGFYPRTQTVDHRVLPRPDSRYGLSKCWGEAVGSLYADKYAVKSLHIRIGNAVGKPSSKRLMAIWISPRDLAQLCRIGLEHPDIHNDIVYGISNNATAWHDNSAAKALGYVPQDSADDYRDFAMEGEAKIKFDPVEAAFQGGGFCALEYAGDLPLINDRAG